MKHRFFTQTEVVFPNLKGRTWTSYIITVTLRNIIACLLTLLLLPLSSRATSWDLERAIEVALANNPDALASVARVEGAEAMLDEVRSVGKPQVSLQGSYRQTDSPMMAFGSILNQRAFDFDLDFNHPGTIDNFNTTAMVGIPLYTGGRLSSGKRAAEAGVNAAEFDEITARHQLIAQTVKAYLNILKTKEAVTAVEAGVDAYQSAVKNAQLRFDAGQMLKADLLSLQVQLARAREQLVETRHFQSLAERAFLFVLGLPAGGESVTIAEKDQALERIVEPDSLSYQARPELRALYEREKAVSEMREVASGARRPSVSGFASVQYDHGWRTDQSGESWLAGVAVDLNVFDGGKTASKVRQADAQLAELRQYIRKAELGIGLEVEQARLALELSRDRVAVTDLALRQAEESASLSRARFEEGALLTAELIGVEGRLMEARMRRAVAVAEEIIAIAELRRAVGFMPIQQ